MKQRTAKAFRMTTSTIQRYWQYRIHKTMKKKKNATQYVLDTTMRKQAQTN